MSHGGDVPAARRSTISVLITTRDRAAFVGRAIESALRQQWPGLEVLVVDDGSSDATPGLVRTAYPEVRYLRQEISQGPGSARNRGIAAAAHEWVVVLDDDDALLPEGVARLAAHIAAWPRARDYPVLQFACDTGRLPGEFLVARLDDYLHEALRGEFTPVIQARAFIASGLAYPAFRAGGESLLWWTVAARWGIPTWAASVVRVGTDAPLRLTSRERQVASAREYAHLQEATLRQFGDLLRARYPRVYRKKRLGAAVYRLLAGDSGRARAHLRHVFRGPHVLPGLALWGLSVLPPAAARAAFAAYRWKRG